MMVTITDPKSKLPVYLSCLEIEELCQKSFKDPCYTNSYHVYILTQVCRALLDKYQMSIYKESTKPPLLVPQTAGGKPEASLSDNSFMIVFLLIIFGAFFVLGLTFLKW